MIIQLNRVEMALLSLTMQGIRKNVKRGFKVNFGKSEGQEKLEVFDEIKAALNDGIERTEEEAECRDFHFNGIEIEMLNDFVPWYLLELEVTYEAAGKEVKGSDKHLIETLNIIKEKLEQVKENYA